jgi:hypothetical protein
MGEGQSSGAVVRLRAQLAKTDCPREWGRAYREFFSKTDRTVWAALRADDDLGLGLHAAWWLSQAGGPQRDHPRPERFLGFIEGRARASIPLRWEVGLLGRALREHTELHARALEGYLTSAAFVVKKPGTFLILPTKLQRTEAGFLAPQGVLVERVGSRLRIRKEGVDIELAKPVMKRLPPELVGDTVFAEVAAQRVYVGFYNAFGTPFVLVCLDRHSGALLWETKVWSLGRKAGLISGPWHQEIEITESANLVWVFGESGDCFVEAFTVSKGAPMCRFSTNYWDAR